jgi:hypothetical protein
MVLELTKGTPCRAQCIRARTEQVSSDLTDSSKHPSPCQLAAHGAGIELCKAYKKRALDLQALGLLRGGWRCVQWCSDGVASGGGARHEHQLSAGVTIRIKVLL